MPKTNNEEKQEANEEIQNEKIEEEVFEKADEIASLEKVNEL